MGARLAARMAFVSGLLALITEPRCQATAKHRMRIVNIVFVVAVPLAGDQGVQAMMDVIIPLRVALLPGPFRPEEPGLVGAVLEHQVDVAPRAGSAANSARDLDHQVSLAIVLDGVHGIESQAVQVILLQPVESVVDEEIADRTARGPVEVDGISPGCLVPLSEEIASVGVEIIALGAEV